MNKRLLGLLVVALAALAQEQPLDPRSSVRIDLADDAPLAVMQADLGQSRATARGGAMILDLRMLLTLKNTSARRVRAVTMLVAAQEVTPGGKASVAVPSLDVAPGATFPIRIDLRLLRPLAAGGGPLINVGLDGVLFSDLSFYGPNRLDSRRAMLVWEAEAQRDRQYFKSVLVSRGPDGLQQEVLASLDRQAVRPRVDVEVARGRAVTSAANERLVRFAFLDMPDAPVAATEGVALVHDNEARAPRIDVQNRSAKEVRHFEIGWLVRDPKGTAYWAASIPGGHEPVPAGASARASQDSLLRFTTSRKEPLSVASMSGYVSQVEFADGNVWVPDRRSLVNHQLLRIVAASAEEQRLVELYRRKGLQALMDELKKF